MTQSINILLVEDDPGDVELIREGFKQTKLSLNIQTAENGKEALAYLHKENPYAKAQDPDLILLDLNMPVMGGKEFLHIFKQDSKIKHIPVIVFTTSNSEEEIVKSYNLGANCYLTKPVNLEQLFKVILAIEDFWLTVVKLPKPLYSGVLLR